MQHVLDKASRVRLAVFDVDGVLTDGRLYLTDSGEQMKAFSTLDGQGLKMLRASGVALAIISGRAARCVELRAIELGIEHLHQGIADKGAALDSLLGALGLPGDAAAFMGDDVVDLPAMRRAGLAIAVPGAPEEVRERADYVTQRPGGQGAVREACELIMRAQGTLDAQLAPYLR